MKIAPGYANLPLRDFNERTMKAVDECRQTVGYQEDPNWECPKFTHGDDYVLAQHPGKDVAGFNCYPCLVKETKERKAKEC